MVAPNTIEIPGGLNAASGDVIDHTALTTDAYAVVPDFPISNPSGFVGIGTIVNQGANDMNVRETVIDKFGNAVSKVTPVLAGDSYQLNLQTDFVSGGTALPPYTDYTVEVQAAVAGNQTTYELHFIDLTPGSGGSGGSGGSESLEQARAIGDTFTGGDVFWSGENKAVFGKSSGQANQDYLQIYSDKTNGAQVIDSTKDGSGTLRHLSFRMGGNEVMSLSGAGDLHVVGKLTVDGAIDPPSISLSGGTALFFESADGVTAPLSAANKARIRYNNTTKTWQQSVDGGAYASFGGGGPGSDTTAWHNAGDNYAAASTIGNLNAGPNTLSFYNDNYKWMEISQDSVGGLNVPRKNILLGNEFTPLSTDGPQWQYKVTNAWALLNLVSDSDGSLGQGTGEALMGLTNDTRESVVLNMIGSAFAGTTYGVPNAKQARIRSTSDNFVIGQINAKPLIFFTNNTPFVKFDENQHVRTGGPVYIGGYSDVTPNIGNEFLRVKGIVHVDTFLGIGADLTVDPTVTIQVRRDVNDGATSLVLDNRNTGGSASVSLRLGNNPAGSNNGLNFSYTTSTDTSTITHSSLTASTFSIGTAGANSFIVFTNSGTAVTVASNHDVTFAGSAFVSGSGVIGGTTFVSNEKLRVAGITHIDSFLGIGANLTVDPTFTLQMRRDAADINTGIVVDNRNGSGNPFFTMGNDPRGTNHSINISYDNSTNDATISHSELAASNLNIKTVGGNPINFYVSNGIQIVFAADGGIAVGAPTGGSKGAGTINVKTDLYKDNSAYNNPDYALEHWATGRIEIFKDNPGADRYKGRMSLDDLEVYCRKNFHLPGIRDARGIFERADVVLEKIEEIFTYLFDLKKQIVELAAA